MSGAIPASIIGVPTDVIKKRLVLGIAKTPMGAIRQVIEERGGVRGIEARAGPPVGALSRGV